MKTVLMVAEKPALALSLAQILSNGKCRTRKSCSSSCSVHEYEGTFRGEIARYKMTSVCGHVMSIDFISSYNNWDRVDPAELFQAPIEKKETNPNLQIPRMLQQEGRNCDVLVLWLDCDKEGENICYEVINSVKTVMRISTRSHDQTVFRAKFSAITDRDIKAAMNQLVFPNENEARSVDARQELDLRIGCAFTRFQTKFFQGKYGNLDSTLISYGPCQTPTLGFCVDRHDQIQSFKPETYWVLQPNVTTPGGTNLLLDWDRVRVFEQDVAQFFLQGIKGKPDAIVTDVSQKKQSRQPPLALNTVELMRVASSGLNMGPHHAMQIAEKLYTQGYISYPRTETTNYPEHFDLKDVLHQMVPSAEWGEDARQLLKEGLHKPRKGNDAGDHPPITPTKLASRNSLDGDAWRLYDYIVRHFIATVSPEMTYLQTVIRFSIGDETFSCSGKTLIDPGFTKVFIWQAMSAEETVPVLKIGDACAINEIKLCERKTGPPDYLTESELITLMEKHAIGTDASIPVHINNICQRNYVTVIAGRRLQPTPLGIVLVHGYQKIDIDLVLPTMRASVEKQLTLIAQGKAEFQSVLQHTLMIFQLKFQYFVTTIQGMDELFEATFSPLSATGKPISKCGRCRRYMKLIESKPMRLHCSTCNETYSVPQNGNIKLYCELKCPLDDFELLQWIGNKNKSYVFCPYCYMNPPPFPGMRASTGCNACTHPTCPHSLTNNGISSCPHCEHGVLVLDPASGPKWKLSCNQCDVVVQLFDGALKLVVEDETCETCSSQIVTVLYKQEKSKLPGGKKEGKGCIFCEESFSALVEKPQTFRPKSFRGRGRGRGTNRGRGAAGGRGGKRRPRDKMDQLAAYFV